MKIRLIFLPRYLCSTAWNRLVPYRDQSGNRSEFSTLQQNMIRRLSDAEYIEIKIFTKWYLGNENLRS